MYSAEQYLNEETVFQLERFSDQAFKAAGKAVKLKSIVRSVEDAVTTIKGPLLPWGLVPYYETPYWDLLDSDQKLKLNHLSWALFYKLIALAELPQTTAKTVFGARLTPYSSAKIRRYLFQEAEEEIDHVAAHTAIANVVEKHYLGKACLNTEAIPITSVKSQSLPLVAKLIAGYRRKGYADQLLGTLQENIKFVDLDGVSAFFDDEDPQMRLSKYAMYEAMKFTQVCYSREWEHRVSRDEEVVRVAKNYAGHHNVDEARHVGWGKLAAISFIEGLGDKDLSLAWSSMFVDYWRKYGTIFSLDPALLWWRTLPACMIAITQNVFNVNEARATEYALDYLLTYKPSTVMQETSVGQATKIRKLMMELPLTDSDRAEILKTLHLLETHWQAV